MTDVLIDVTNLSVGLAVSQIAAPTLNATTQAGPSIVVGDISLGFTDLVPIDTAANATALANQHIRMNAAAGARTVIVPVASGALSVVSKVDTSANAVTITLGGGGNTIIYEVGHARIMLGNGTTADVIADRKLFGYADYVDSTSKSGSYTLVKTDAGTVIEYNSASAGTFTIPAFATVPWVDGSTLEFYQASTGQLTVAHATSSAHLKPYPASSFKTAGQDATIGLRYKASGDLWVMSGALTT